MVATAVLVKCPVCEQETSGNPAEIRDGDGNLKRVRYRCVNCGHTWDESAKGVRQGDGLTQQDRLLAWMSERAGQPVTQKDCSYGLPSMPPKTINAVLYKALNEGLVHRPEPGRWVYGPAPTEAPPTQPEPAAEVPAPPVEAESEPEVGLVAGWTAEQREEVIAAAEAEPVVAPLLTLQLLEVVRLLEVERDEWREKFNEARREEQRCDRELVVLSEAAAILDRHA